ncbi:MAG: putative urea ABC transporter substrate-binding protein [bacterium]
MRESRFFTLFLISIITIMVVATIPLHSFARPKKYTVAWSIYAGWMPWDYAGYAGILKKWADKYGIAIDLVRMDYIPSVEAFVAKKVDGCVMTNMECLDMPASSGIDCTVLIMGDFSNGNDAILTRDGIGIAGLKGKDIYLVELSVSHYLLARCLEMNGLKEKDVRIVNTSDSDIGPVFLSNKSQKAVVTWNPIVMEIEQVPGISKIYTSANIPGEILDLMVVSTDVLNKNPDFGKALTGAWYEVMDMMSKRGPVADKALTYMAESAGTSLVEYKRQLATTAMFYTPQSATDYTKGSEIKEKMNFVRKFCFDHGLLGENAPSMDIVGISYPDGTIQGDRKNIKMRFDSTYMQRVADEHL